MSLRPRYSLLTLLLLTALVAGGVKWWRGPHQVILDPAASADREDFADLLMFLEENAKLQRTPDELRCSYRRGWALEIEIQGLLYTFKRPVYLITGRYHNDPSKRYQFFLRSEAVPTDTEIQTAAARSPFLADFVIEQVEQLHFWICAAPKNGPLVLAGDLSPENKHGESVLMPEARDLYLGTAVGKIFRRIRGPAHLELMYDAPYFAIELRDIESPEMRAQIEAEFARHHVPTPPTR